MKCMRAGSRWKRFRRRLRYWLDHSERQRLLWEEMEFHIESMTQELAAQGLSEPDARAAAHRKFGNMAQKSEEARSTWIARWMSDLTQDLRHSGSRNGSGRSSSALTTAEDSGTGSDAKAGDEDCKRGIAPHAAKEAIPVRQKGTPPLRHGRRIPNRGADGHRKDADRKGGSPRYLLRWVPTRRSHEGRCQRHPPATTRIEGKFDNVLTSSLLFKVIVAP